MIATRRTWSLLNHRAEKEGTLKHLKAETAQPGAEKQACHALMSKHVVAWQYTTSTF